MLKAGQQYRVSAMRVMDPVLRHKLIALGVIPGVVLRVQFMLCFGHYLVVKLQQQLIGLRMSEWLALNVHMIEND